MGLGFEKEGIALGMTIRCVACCAILWRSPTSGGGHALQAMRQIGKTCRNVLQYRTIASFKSSSIFAPHLAFAGTYVDKM